MLRVWKGIRGGHSPNLSIEITRECPLRCPGCYAYGDTHLGGGIVLRELADFKGQELIDNLLRVVRERKPARGVGAPTSSTLACRSGRLARPTKYAAPVSWELEC